MMDHLVIGESTTTTKVTKSKRLSPVSTLKFIVLGDRNVGKTRFIEAIKGDNGGIPSAPNANGASSPRQSNRVRVIATDVVEYKLRTEEWGTVNLQIWDSVGEEYIEAIANNIYRGANGIIILYDVTNRESFINVAQRWLPKIRSIMGEGGYGDETIEDILKRGNASVFRILFVANKIDLETQRTVTIQDGKSLADMYRSPYVFLSAHTGSRDSIKLPLILLTQQLMPLLTDAITINPSRFTPSTVTKGIQLMSIEETRLGKDGKSDTTESSSSSITCC